MCHILTKFDKGEEKSEEFSKTIFNIVCRKMVPFGKIPFLDTFLFGLNFQKCKGNKEMFLGFFNCKN